MNHEKDKTITNYPPPKPSTKIKINSNLNWKNHEGAAAVNRNINYLLNIYRHGLGRKCSTSIK